MTKFIDSCNLDFLNEKILNIIPQESKNILFYGSNESKLYTYAISYLKNKSPSNLSYEKKITVNYNNDEYIFRISDVHIEINFEFLGCIAKNLWSVIYNQIIALTGNKKFNILCRNFCSINNELLDNFYTYMNNEKSNISFIFLVNNISCLPNELINSCNIIPLKRIANSKNHLGTITNNFVEKIYSLIKNYKSFNVKTVRGFLYDILIYQIDVYEFFYELLKKINDELKPSQEKMFKLLNELNKILKLFNNNYRSIYHLENMVLSIITILYY